MEIGGDIHCTNELEAAMLSIFFKLDFNLIDSHFHYMDMAFLHLEILNDKGEMKNEFNKYSHRLSVHW